MAIDYDNVIVLEDADGDEAEYEIMDVIPLDGHEYAVLLPLDNDADPTEAVVLEVLPANEGEAETLSGIADPSVLYAVFQLFLQRNNEDVAD